MSQLVAKTSSKDQLGLAVSEPIRKNTNQSKTKTSNNPLIGKFSETISRAMKKSNMPFAYYVDIYVVTMHLLLLQKELSTSYVRRTMITNKLKNEQRGRDAIRLLSRLGFLVEKVCFDDMRSTSVDLGTLLPSPADQKNQAETLYAVCFLEAVKDHGDELLSEQARSILRSFFSVEDLDSKETINALTQLLRFVIKNNRNKKVLTGEDVWKFLKTKKWVSMPTLDHFGKPVKTKKTARIGGHEKKKDSESSVDGEVEAPETKTMTVVLGYVRKTDKNKESSNRENGKTEKDGDASVGKPRYEYADKYLELLDIVGGLT